MSEFKKRQLILRQQLIGRGYSNALVAMEFAASHHKGTRKDNVTPEFDHQVSIALYALTLPNLIHPHETIATIMLHDVREDYHVSNEEIHGLFTDQPFAYRVAVAVERMTKEYRGVKREPQALFAAMSDDPIASIAKLCDRVHNFQSMVGVFSIQKQVEYIEEAEKYFLPMLKKARRKFPHQVTAYENIKWMLKSQIELIRAVHKASE